ncbi:hypothetical protein NEOLEDRAFT_1018980, partial [Neolentinus lepideus HHB14362 ss-1]
MLRTAKHYGVSFAPVQLSQGLKRQMPAFYHLGSPPRTYRVPKIACLVGTHMSTSQRVSGLIHMAKRLDNTAPQPRHNPQRNCACEPCKQDRRDGCKNPHKCAKTARAILDSLSPLTNISSKPPQDNLTLTHRRLEKNRQARLERGKITFNPTVTAKTHLAECFRIFLDPSETSTSPAYRLQAPAPGLNIQDEHLVIY